jgi:hypothetical protein
MAIVRKFTLGIQPFTKCFRVHGLGGIIADSVLQLRGNKLPEDYFSEFFSDPEKKVHRLSSKANFLQISESEISFTKDYYDSDSSFRFEKVLEEFRILWKCLNGTLHITDIRRIGMVAEYRYDVGAENNVEWLRKKLTTIPAFGLSAKAALIFEERFLQKTGAAIDTKKDDFLTTIYTLYDSMSDASHPVDGFVNLSVDVQRYFSPLLNKDVGDETLILRQHLNESQKKIDAHLTNLGAKHAAK